MTKVLSLVLAFIFFGTFMSAAEAGRCDPQRTGAGITVYPFCREAPRVGVHFGFPRGHHRHRCHRGCGHRYPMYRPQYQPIPVMQAPQCRPCIDGFARVPMPGKPCWCEPIQ